VKIAPRDRSHTSSYWRSTVTMALACIVSEILNVEQCMPLKSGLMVIQDH